MSRPATPFVGAAFAVALAGMIGTIAPVSGQTQTAKPAGPEASGPMGHAAHARRQAGSAGQLDQRDADAARAHGRRRRHADRRAGRGDRRPRAVRRGVSRQGQRSESPAPPKGGEAGRLAAPGEQSFIEQISEAAGGAVGGYNGFWLDPGLNVIRIDGVARSSIIIDPPNGRMPALTDAGKKRMAEIARARAASSASSIIPKCGRSPTAACCRSDRTPGRRCCRTTSTTTTTRSCRRRIT